MTKLILTISMAVVCFTVSPPSSIFAYVADAGSQVDQPDFTRGDSVPDGSTHDWNLGPTGARGWIYSHRLETTDARQVLITAVEKGSPADGLLKVGDVILGVSGQLFTSDPRVRLGKAIGQAELPENQGRLNLMRWRDGKTESVVINLPAIGSYSQTAPWDCDKSEQILEQGLRALAVKVRTPAYRPVPITRSLNGLALLASGDQQFDALVKKEAEWAANFTTNGYKSWHYGYVMMFLAEYVMASGDESVLPGLRRLAMETAVGQSVVGSWGHRFVQGNGRLAGYGMMNSPGIPLTIGLVLARKAGVSDPEVAEAINKSARLLRFYAGKGAIPYGDHRPWIQTHDDNGKNGMAAVLFDLLDEPEQAEYFSRMSVACHGPERDCGHTGNFFNMIWAMPGVARSGSHATGAWMGEFGGWYFDLARRWDGSFIHQGPPQARHDSYRNWDCTGAYLLAYAMPKRSLYLTGKGSTGIPQVNSSEARQLVDDGRGWSNNDRKTYYDSLTTEQLISRLSSWSPTVRQRTAEALGRKRDDVVSELKVLLESPHLHSRYGACQALQFQGRRGAAAVPSLIETLQSGDLWLRILAAEALAGIGEPAKPAVPTMLKRLALKQSADDPRNMEQRYLSMALFNQRGGLIGRSLEGVNRQLLADAVRAGLRNEDGRARGSFSSVYTNLTFDEIQPLMPAIYQAIVEPAPSGIMFADGIQNAGLELFAKHHIEDGIELLADYAKTQKKHGSQKRIVKVMSMLESYGAHAQRVIPQLQATAYYFENEEAGFPKKLSRDKAKVVRSTIERIASSSEMPTLKPLKKETRSPPSN